MRTYPFSDTKYLCISSGLIGLSSAILFFLNEKFGSFLMGILFLTSINHWRHFVLGGWKQRLDVAWIILMGCFLFTLVILYKSNFHIWLSLSVAFTMMLFYIYTHLFERYWIVAHSSIHIYAAFFITMIYIL